MTKLKLKTWVALLAVLAVAVLIFYFSSQAGEDSSKLSGKVTRLILSVLVPGFGQLSLREQLRYLDRWGLIVRKLAHFWEYTALAATLVNYLHYRLKGRGKRLMILTAWAAATAYACTDELHQLFVSDRGGALTDVCIDTAGALLGALLGMLLIRLWHRLRGKSDVC